MFGAWVVLEPQTRSVAAPLRGPAGRPPAALWLREEGPCSSRAPLRAQPPHATGGCEGCPVTLRC